MKQRRAPRLQLAFTLVEILVTLAVVAALALLLFAAVRSATHGAIAARCTGNLREIGTLFANYLGDHQMQYPFSVMRPTPTAANRFWPQELVEHSGSPTALHSFICPAVKDLNPDLQRYIGGHAYVSYAINRYGVAPAQTDNYLPARALNIAEPSRVLLALDFDSPSQPYDGWYTATRQGCRNEWSVLSKRHGSVNALYCDGRVEKLHRDRDTSGTDSAFPWSAFQYIQRP